MHGIVMAAPWVVLFLGLPSLLVLGLWLNLTAWAEERAKRRSRTEPPQSPPEGVWPPSPADPTPPPET